MTMTYHDATVTVGGYAFYVERCVVAAPERKRNMTTKTGTVEDVYNAHPGIVTFIVRDEAGNGWRTH